MPIPSPCIRAALVVVAACRPAGDDQDSSAPAHSTFSFPSVETLPPLRGAGGPAVSFSEDELFVNCAPLMGPEEDVFKHHNLVVPYRGHLVMPWVPEWGRGGLSFLDVSDPCAPTEAGWGYSETMRESHALGFAMLPEGDPNAGEWMVATGVLGIEFWDVSEVEAPASVSYLQLPGVFYPDAYALVVLSVFWQYPHVYVAGADNGVYIVDATDPRDPVLVGQYTPEPGLRAGGVFAMGTLLMVSSAEQTESILLDISDPASPQPIPGGRYESVDSEGIGKEAYHATMAGDWALYARKEGGGGVMMMDISDPTRPVYAGDYRMEGGNGGYVYYDEGFAFVGESHFATVYDVRDPTEITVVGTGDLPGDLDTVTPYGNVAILSVDEDAEDGVASAVMPWSTEPDSTPPVVLRVVPADGATGVALTARVGVGFSEMIEPTSAMAGSLRLFDAEGVAVEGWGSAQEGIASYSPASPLRPGTTYTLEVVEGGVRDVNGNTIAETFTSTFTTAGGR